MNNSNVLDNIDPDFIHLLPDTSLCKYYSLAEYANVMNLHAEKNSIKLLNFNIRSFHSNGDAFSSVLETLPILPDFLVISESWNTAENLDLCSVNNYDSHHTFRNSGRGGGVSVFTLNSYSSSRISCISVCNLVLETCVIKVDLPNSYLVIIGIYRPPGDGITPFIEALDLIIKNDVVKNAELVLIAGDTNINLNNPNSTHVDNYLACLQSSFFLPVITKFTRFPADPANHSPTNLDHIFLNKALNFESGVLDIQISDHCPTFINIPYYLAEPNKPKIKVQFRLCNDRNLELFSAELSTIKWDNLNSGDINSLFHSFNSKLNLIYCKHFPLKTKFISQKRFRKPWLTQRLKKLITSKSEYFKLYRLGIISKQTNDSHKKMVNITVKKSKREYYFNAFNQCRNDIKRNWDIIRGLMGNKSIKKHDIKKLVVEDKIFTSEKCIAEAFNHFFTNVAQNLANSLPVSNLEILDFMPSAPPQYFQLNPVTESECLNIISSLKNSKTDIDSLPVKIFKIVSASLVQPICLLINNSFTTGIFPDYFKTARITQIFKSGNPEDPSNYRPIASIPYMSKIFEKCICTRLVDYFNEFSIFTDVQYGFRSGRSTSDALIDMTDAIYKSLNNKNHHINVLIDLKKAFDTVSHQILSKKLYHYGVRGIPLKLLENFLLNRKQYVKIGKECSSILNNPIGLPQGSNLGPILFLVYINDFPHVSNLLKTILFADDSSFSLSGRNYETLINTLNIELDKINNWTIANKLTINVSKTQLLLFTNRYINANNAPISVGGKNLEIITTCNYLGVHIDSRLTFKPHIGYVLSKIAKNTGILYRIRDNLPMKARLDFYYSMIYPYMTYNVIVWGGTYQSHLSNLILQQKRTIRVLCNIPFYGHTSPVFHKYRILKFLDIYRYYICIYMFKNKNSPLFRTIHVRNTRNRHLAQPSFNRLSACQNSLSFMGPHIWNDLPQFIRDSSTIDSFKRALKLYYIQSYL